MIWYVAAGSALRGTTRYPLGSLIQQRAGVDCVLLSLLLSLAAMLLGFAAARRRLAA